MAYPADLKYTKDHEWIRIDGDSAEIGITDFAQKQLGDSFGSIESVKAVSELFVPMSGEVLAVNPALKDRPESVNTDPHGAWMVRLRLSDPADTSALLDAAQYEAFTRAEGA